MMQVISKNLKGYILFLFLGLIGKTQSQAIKFDKSFYVIPEGKTDHVLRIYVESATKKRDIKYIVLDNHEGTADQNDYNVESPLSGTLKKVNAYGTSILIKIKGDGNEEKNEMIKLHFLFNSFESNEQIDSVITITILNDDHDKKFYSEVDTSNIIKTEFIQFTDFLGFTNDRPNGILQQQFLFKWPISKKYCVVSENVKVQFLRSILLPNILFNRIEKSGDNNNVLFPVSTAIKIKDIDSSGFILKDTVISPVISSFDIHRYTSQKLETRIILLAVFVDKTRIHLQYTGSIVRNRVADSITTSQKTERAIYSFSSGWSIYVKSILGDKTKLNIEAELGFMKFYLKDNFFKQYDVYKLDNIEKRAIAFPVIEGNSKSQRPIYYTRITLSKDWGKESKNSTFFRIRYNYQDGVYKFFEKPNLTLIKEERYYNHFLQLQLGVSLGLEKVFGG